MLTNCYFPSGTISPDDRPCNALATASACCNIDDICLDTGYCIRTGGGTPISLSRGSCTDSSFGSTECPQLCADVHPYTGQPIGLVINPSHNDLWCCGGYSGGSANAACELATNSSTTPFKLPVGKLVTNRTDGSTTALDQLLSCAAAQETAAVTATTTAGPMAKCGPDVAKVTVGIAVPLGVLLLAALGGMWYLWQTLQTTRQQMAERDDSLELQKGPLTVLYKNDFRIEEQHKIHEPNQLMSEQRHEAEPDSQVHELEEERPAQD